jgi:hypothetical protein
VFLTTAPGGKLFLLGASTTGATYAGVELQVMPANGTQPPTMAVTGGVSGSGTLLFRPSVTAQGLTLPMKGASSTAGTEVCTTIQRGESGTVADAQICSNTPTVTTLADGNLGSQVVGIAGTLTSRSMRRFLMSFDVSAIPTGALINSATLTVTETYVYGAGTLEVHTALVPWTESGVTWNNFGGDTSIGSTVVASQPTGNGSAAHAFDVKSALTAWVAAPGTNDGFVITEPSSSYIFTDLASSEATASTTRPKLHVCYTPSADPVHNTFVPTSALPAGATQTIGTCL